MKKIDLISAGTDTVIGTGVKIKGTLASESDITINGTLNGEIRTSGNVSIGVNGIVKADIKAQNVTVAGHLLGNIMAENETTVTESGHVKGDITTAVVAIGPGAIFIGRINMTSTEAEILPEQTGSPPTL